MSDMVVRSARLGNRTFANTAGVTEVTPSPVRQLMIIADCSASWADHRHAQEPRGLGAGSEAERLSDWRSFLQRHWCQLHRTLVGRRHDKFGPMMFLATLAYAQEVRLDVIEILVVLYNVSRLAELRLRV